MCLCKGVRNVCLLGHVGDLLTLTIMCPNSSQLAWDRQPVKADLIITFVPPSGAYTCAQRPHCKDRQRDSKRGGGGGEEDTKLMLTFFTHTQYPMQCGRLSG